MAKLNLTLDLRSYSGHTPVHHHDYHQLVLPVDGRLSMSIAGRDGEVSSDGLALVAAGRDHGFTGSDRIFWTQPITPGESYETIRL